MTEPRTMTNPRAARALHTGPGPDPNDLSRFLAERAAGMAYGDLAPADVDAAKRSILDTLGVSLAATTAAPKAVDPVRAYMQAYASTGSAPCLTLGTRAHPLDAVFWLGAISHALDFDDVAGYCHPSASVVAAVLPLLSLDGPVDGRRLLVATALGQDLVIRIAQSLHRPVSDHGWLHSLPGVFGSAIAAAKLLGLDAQQTRDCLGLTLHQTAGTMQALARPGSDFRGIREGFSARAGVVAALLAGKGMAGDPESMEGQFGLFQQFCNGEYDADFTRQPGLLAPRITYKPWPCAGHPQLFLTALAQLLARTPVPPETIKTIRITGCSALLPHQCEPLEQRAAPPHGIDAKVSLPFLLGKIARHGTLSIGDFTDEGLRDADATAIARRVQWAMDDTLQRGTNGYGVGVVELDLTDGRTLRHETEFPLGHPQNPLSWDDLVRKFRQCAEASASPVSRAVVDEVVGLVANLESLPDAAVIVETLFKGME
jgi:2-methylcitrate dehydratase PrpD